MNDCILSTGCQMLDLPPTYKYERPFGKSGAAAKITTGASLVRLFSACHRCRIPAAAARDLLNWTLFQLIIGNNDAHGKNISFFVGAKGIDVAPAYDLVNIDIYGNLYDRDLAMAVGDTFRGEEIHAYQLAAMCEECGLPRRQVAVNLKKLCTDMLNNLDTLPSAEALTDDEQIFAHELGAKIRANSIRGDKGTELV